MKELDPKLVQKVRGFLKGARLKKLDASVAVLNESLAQGAWVLRGSAKASSGFNQGIMKAERWVLGTSEKTEHWNRCVQYGSPLKGRPLRSDIPGYIQEKLGASVAIAWALLCAEKVKASALLDAARPLPIITAIGLSPKVTKTLTECNLDLELSSIKVAKIVRKKRQKINMETGEKMVDADGEPVLEFYHIIVWSPGVLHGKSRFLSGCHACGKHIPSGRFVPIEAFDKRQGEIVSMWLGLDCASNIFGVKDIGVEKPNDTIRSKK